MRAVLPYSAHRRTKFTLPGRIRCNQSRFFRRHVVLIDSSSEEGAEDLVKTCRRAPNFRFAADNPNRALPVPEHPNGQVVSDLWKHFRASKLTIATGYHNHLHISRGYIGSGRYSSAPSSGVLVSAHSGDPINRRIAIASETERPNYQLRIGWFICIKFRPVTVPIKLMSRSRM